MSCKCPECRADYSSNPNCGLRLFHSQNECAICLEICEEMVALPCGHQFCRQDLEHIGLFLAKAISKKSQVSNVDIVSTNVNRTFQHRVHRIRHCSWCGHAGHTVRSCTEHKEKCGCTGASGEHQIILRNLSRCSTCNRRGHDSAECGTIVIN